MFFIPVCTMTTNIFGPDPEQTVQKSSVYSDKNKSTIFDEAPPVQPSTKPDRQRSTIFDAEPVQQTVQSARPVSEKFKSNIFGNGDGDNQKRAGAKQAVRGRSQTNNQDNDRPSIAISLYSPLRQKGRLVI